MAGITIRKARKEDHPRLVDFNRAMARETEGIELIHDVISAGVRSILDNPPYGFYLVAEREGEIVAGLLVTTEWSDWRNGVFWWVQSVYVVPSQRRQGVYRSMYDFVRRLADEEPLVCGFRLYVEEENVGAQTTYRSMGMQQKSYLMFEELTAGTRFTT